MPLSNTLSADFKYRKPSNIGRPQKIVAPNFSWFFIGSRSIPTRPIFNFKPYLKPLYQELYFELEIFCLTLIVYKIRRKIVSPKKTKVGKDSRTIFWGFTVYQSCHLFCPMIENLKISKALPIFWKVLLFC